MKFLVFSGLPGSGKSTVARDVARRLSLPVLDKDDFLDALFDERGVGDASWRSALSREADTRFIDAARRLFGACLVSWWRHREFPAATGTPIAWLASLPSPVVEVYCRCRPATAASRFLARQRHPGHLDATRSRSAVEEQFALLVAAGPLRIGRLIEIDTEPEVNQIDIDGLVRALHEPA